MPQQKFEAQIAAFVAKSEKRATAVFRESAERVIEKMQEVGPSVSNSDSSGTGNMPVRTGFLRRSLMTSTSQMPTINSAARPTSDKYNFDESEITLAIAGADLGDTIFAGYTAAYAGHVEYGSNGVAGRGFVRLAAQQWPQIVNQVVREVKAKVK